jgi:hypothetical protein
MTSENRATSAEMNNSPIEARNVAVGGIHSKAQDFYGKADSALYDSRVKRGVQNQPWPGEKTGHGGDQRSGAFERANQSFERHEAARQSQSPQSPAGQNSPGAPWGGKRRGWSNQARIAAAKARGLQNLPYGGDPNAGPSEWAPGGQK